MSNNILEQSEQNHNNSHNVKMSHIDNFLDIRSKVLKMIKEKSVRLQSKFPKKFSIDSKRVLLIHDCKFSIFKHDKSFFYSFNLFDRWNVISQKKKIKSTFERTDFIFFDILRSVIPIYEIANILDKEKKSYNKKTRLILE